MLASSLAKPEVTAKQSVVLEKKPRSYEFGRKYKKHFGMSTCTNMKQYNREYAYYRYHKYGKCRWVK